MRSGLLALLCCSAVAAPPALPAWAGAGAHERAAAAGPAECADCCCANSLVCDHNGCCAGGAGRAGGGPRATSTCLCAHETPQQNREPRSDTGGGAEGRAALAVSTTCDRGQEPRDVARVAPIPRRWPHPEVRPPLLI